MKNVLFIISHLHSGHEHLVNCLNQNDRIDLNKNRFSYDHPEVLNHLFSLKHKNLNSASIYGDLILNNKDFSCKSFYNFAKFIFLIRKPDETLPLILQNESSYTEKSALLYYNFRIRRIYEMAYEIKNFVFINYEDLVENKFNNIKNYLKLNKEITFYKPEEVSINYRVDPKILIEANKCYEKYLYKINQLVSQN